ncbi:energy-coupling factor transporter transmembrane component T [Nocardioides insulae]|uniref:energy-coupling factor transporter transmembrane component T n=1 Tax=Nocardioides insulae TaxID=394734 RepID=UPI002480DC14|nr:energy-coupling factor transporter transmembrane component T [Nocardioides insulae]
MTGRDGRSRRPGSARALHLPRDLHPVAWWLWAIGLAAYASQTTNPWLLLLLCAVAALVVAARRSDQPWANAFKLYAVVAAFIVLTRVLFRIVFGSGDSGTVIWDLPEIPLPDFALGITLLGPVTREALLSGLYDGLRLGTIVLCLGAATALANPKRLLRSVPPALYEIGTALVVAVTVLPQLADSVRRVRAAQRLRPAPESTGFGRRTRRLRRFLVPVLEDALERSLALAAGMDTRGYGRAGEATPAQRRVTGGLMLAGLVGVCVGVYAVLDSTAPRLLAGPLLVVGLALAIAGLVSAGRRVHRTFYRPDPWRWPESIVTLSGLAVAAAGWWVAHHDLAIAYPDVTLAPQVSLAALAGVAVGLVPAVAAPPPRRLAADLPVPELQGAA